jgi:hypothetical protein
MDRKKLEPIKNNIPSFNNTNSTGHSITENEATLSQNNANNLNGNNYNEEELSVSENTLSSDKQQMMGTIRIQKKKVNKVY